MKKRIAMMSMLGTPGSRAALGLIGRGGREGDRGFCHCHGHQVMQVTMGGGREGEVASSLLSKGGGRGLGQGTLSSLSS